MPAERTDLYAAMGLAPHATQEEVRRAYRAIMRRNHPDTRLPTDSAGGTRSDAVLAEVMAAYAVLGDPDRRAEYDHHLAPPRRHRPWPVPAVRLVPADRGPEPPIRVGPVIWRPIS